MKLNTYNLHLNHYKEIAGQSAENSFKVNIYETVYMHMTNRNPVSLLNQQMLNEDHDDYYYETISKSKDIFSYLHKNLKNYFYQLVD